MTSGTPIRSIIVGRAPTCHWVVNLPSISQQHARFDLFADGQTRVTDLNSANGVFVNGAQVQACAIVATDQLQFGSNFVDIQAILAFLNTSVQQVQETAPSRKKPGLYLGLYIGGALVLVLGLGLTLILSQGGGKSCPGCPPDPGSEGIATLEGIDSDGDGLRDDVQRHLIQEYRTKPKAKKSLTESALALQGMIVDRTRRNDVANHVQRMVRAYECLHMAHPDLAEESIDRMFGHALNTEARLKAYLTSTQRLGAEVIPLTVEDEVVCGFDSVAAESDGDAQ